MTHEFVVVFSLIRQGHTIRATLHEEAHDEERKSCRKIKTGTKKINE